MKNTLKFMLALAVSLLLMMAFRALVATIYAVDGRGLEPEFMAGDHVMVNRWSYGLRTGDDGLFAYGRLFRSPVQRGDLVAYEDPRDSTSQPRVLFGRCRALPGDTVRYNGRIEQVPAVADCADADYYWMQALGEGNPLDSRQLGFVSEKRIIGRACLIVFSHHPDSALFRGHRPERLLLLK